MNPSPSSHNPEPEFVLSACKSERQHSLVFKCFFREVCTQPGFHIAEINDPRKLLFFHALGFQQEPHSLIAVRLGCYLGGYPNFYGEFAGYRLGLFDKKKETATIDISDFARREDFHGFFAELGLFIQNRPPATSLNDAVIQFLNKRQVSWDHSSFAIS